MWALGKWRAENQYTVAGGVREVYLQGGMETHDPHVFLIEI